MIEASTARNSSPKSGTPGFPFTAALAVYLVFPVLSQADLIGKLVDWQGAPLAGCRASLVRAKVSTQTSAQGGFRFELPAGLHSISQAYHPQGHRIRFQVARTGPVRISLHALDGALVAEVVDAALSPGDYSFEPSAYLSTSDSRAVHIMRIRIAGVQSTMKVPALPASNPAGKGLRSEETPSRSIPKISTNIPALDTLVLACADLPAKRVPITQTEGDLGTFKVRPPNLVVVFLDDGAYADIGPFGAKGYPTPNIDRLADGGSVFRSFYVAEPVCTASRGALLTGVYPPRFGLGGAIAPGSAVGLGSQEITLAELVKQKGYATGIFGKWHLGDKPQFLPTRHGFDEYFGLPYSNDMWPFNTYNPEFPDLPLYENEKVIDSAIIPQEQTQLTTRYTEKSVSFIRRNKDKPFFLYLPHSMPHVPLYVSDKHKGKSGAGLYGDVMMEIDWSVGEILRTLKETGLEEDTWVVFTSDNGPWLIFGDHAGSAGPLREGKMSVWEGGVRVPCIMRWPGHILAGAEVDEPAMTIDILPTMAALIGAKLPDHKIDGRDIRPLFAGGRAQSQEPYYFYHTLQLKAMRSGKWKLALPHSYVHPTAPGNGGVRGTSVNWTTPLALYDIVADIGEKQDVAAAHPEVVQRLKALADKQIQEMELTKRPPGR